MKLTGGMTKIMGQDDKDKDKGKDDDEQHTTRHT
jgi:hypothetical protein